MLDFLYMQVLVHSPRSDPSVHVGSNPCLQTKRGCPSSAQVETLWDILPPTTSCSHSPFLSLFLSSETLQYFPLLFFSTHLWIKAEELLFR